MRDKLLDFNSCVSIFEANFQRSFGTVSPINAISGSNLPSLYSWMGSVSYTSTPSIAFGTIERWRTDFNDPMPLNRDQWILWSTGTASIVRVKEVEKSKIIDHWSNGLPSDVEKDSPNWVKNFINIMLLNK